MNKKDERNLNITLKNETEEKKDIIVSLSGIFKYLKKYFLVWVITVVVSTALIFAGTAILSPGEHSKLTALISFSYDGIEEGLDPNGNNFDINTIKNPTVIQSALTELNMSIEDVEVIRSNISIQGIIPSDAIDRITTYQSVLENSAGTSGAISAAQALLDTSYYPSQFKISFDYSETDYDSDQAVELFNTVLECYRDYFISEYGYNEALGSAVSSIDYNDYDYAEAVDVFDSTLSTLKTYVDDLADEDTSRFRSSQTGYTFEDLSDAISTVRTMDLDILSSYITVNNVTKDKDSLITYYQYRIDSLTREKTVAEEKLATITDSINSYQKDTVMIYGGTENTDAEYTQYSEEYDNLVKQKISAQTEVSTDTQRIDYYTKRIETLKSKPTGSDTKIEKVETDLSSLSEKVNQLIEDVNTTATEYYENVPFANAYNILVPASAVSAGSVIKNILSSSLIPFIIVEALLFVIYICVAFVMAVSNEYKKKNVVESAEASEDSEDSDDTGEIEAAAEEEAGKDDSSGEKADETDDSKETVQDKPETNASGNKRNPKRNKK